MIESGRKYGAKTRLWPKLGGRAAVRALMIAAAVCGTGLFSFAQLPDGLSPAPPPLRKMSAEERTALNAETSVKKRTKLALSLMDKRLENAETANTGDDLDRTFKELGAFRAIMDYTLNYLESSDSNRGKVLDNFKRFEIGLRKFTSRLELLRREMPLTHEVYVRGLLRDLRNARTRATEPLFGHSVIPSRNNS